LRHRRAELQHPPADRLIGDLEPTLSEEFLHVAVAQGEAEIEPNRVLDNRRRKAVAAIGEQGHAEMLSYPPFSRLTRFRDNAVTTHVRISDTFGRGLLVHISFNRLILADARAAPWTRHRVGIAGISYIY
jgi:hypothetical protein